MIVAFPTPRFVRFIVAGAIGAAVNLASRAVFNLVVSYEVAVVLAFPVALTAGFMVNRFYVFNSRDGAVGGQYMRYTAVNLVALPPVWIVSVALDRWLFPAIGFTWHADTIAHGIGLLFPVALSYFGHKSFTFQKMSGAKS